MSNSAVRIVWVLKSVCNKLHCRSSLNHFAADLWCKNINWNWDFAFLHNVQCSRKTSATIATLIFSYFPKMKKLVPCCFYKPTTFCWHFAALQLQWSLLVSNPALGVRLKLWEQAAEKLNTLDISTSAPCLGTFPTSRHFQTSPCCLEFKSNTHFFLPTPLWGRRVWGEIFCRLVWLLPLNDRSSRKETACWRGWWDERLSCPA